MAFTLSTIYKGIDKMTPVLKKMEQANASFALKQDKAMRVMGNAISNVKNQLIGLAGGLSVASLMFIGARAITEYDTALNSLSAITGVTGKKFDELKSIVLETASATKKSAVDVAKAFELVGSAQPELLKDAKGLSMVSKAAIILSKASRDDLATSAANVTGVLNQFRLGANEAERAINVLSAGAVVGAANISEITEAMKNSGTVMASANMTMEQSVALLEVFGKFQLKGAEAGTKARGVILKLQQAGLGYASGQFNINDAIADANKKLKTMGSEVQKDAYLQKTFGAENITAGKILLNNTALLEEYTKGVTNTSSAYDMAKINSQSFSVKLQELKSRFENLIIKGNENSRILNKFGNIISFVTDNLDKIIATIGTAIALFASYYAIMTTVRIATMAYNVALGIYYATQSSVPIALNASSVAMSAYAVASKIATAATWLFSAALWANPITWIVIGVLALVAAVVLLIAKWKAIINWFKTSNSFFAKFLRAIIYPLIIAFKAIAHAVKWVWEKLKQFTNWFVNTAVFKFMVKMIRPVVAVFRALGQALSWVWDKIKAVWDFLKRVGKAAMEPIMKVIDKFSAGTQAELNVNTNTETPVNVQKSSNDAITSRYEEITKNQLDIQLTNKTDKNANIKANPAKVPVLTKTR